MYDNEDEVCGIAYGYYGTFYFQKNLQGDVIGITNADGELVAEYTYDAWGACTILSDTSGRNIATLNPFRYRGYYYDTETGLYYLQSRYYDPATGRFINADEIFLLLTKMGTLSHNLFSYCSNCPIVQEDPYGFAGSSIAAYARPSVTLCINSPNINSNQCLTLNSGNFNVGHVFLKLKPNRNAKEPKKYLVDCAFGFEPKTNHTARVALFQKYYAGRIAPNDHKPYNISVIYPVTQRQYKLVYDFCHPKTAPRYHIVKYNCATFALKALEYAKIKHKFKKKSWNLGGLSLLVGGFGFLYFYGYCPAQMARDVITGKY